MKQHKSELTLSGLRLRVGNTICSDSDLQLLDVVCSESESDFFTASSSAVDDNSLVLSVPTDFCAVFFFRLGLRCSWYSSR